jgi:hypothetical protein
LLKIEKDSYKKPEIADLVYIEDLPEAIQKGIDLNEIS